MCTCIRTYNRDTSLYSFVKNTTLLNDKTFLRTKIDVTEKIYVLIKAHHNILPIIRLLIMHSGSDELDDSNLTEEEKEKLRQVMDRAKVSYYI